MKRIMICVFLLGFGIVCVQAGMSTEGTLAFAGIRVVPDPDLVTESGRTGGTIRTSELIDRVVKNPQGQDLGQVKDLVVDRDGRIAFIVISGNESEEGNLVPVPFKSLLFGGYENWLVLSNVNKSKFANAPSIRRDEWSRLEDPAFEREVFSYYGRQ